MYSEREGGRAVSREVIRAMAVAAVVVWAGKGGEAEGARRGEGVEGVAVPGRLVREDGAWAVPKGG
jgi:hypothetical protein